jgi:hypothetical protein
MTDEQRKIEEIERERREKGGTKSQAEKKEYGPHH